MKKFLSIALVAMMLVAVAAVSVSALDWTSGEGLWVHEGANYGDAVATELSPVDYTVAEDGSVSVKQGGYWKAPYTDGGVVTTEPVGLDGLEVTVKFDRVPAATNDCWFALHLMDKPQLFTTDGNTMGYKNLIRFGDPKMEYYNAAWGGNGSSDIGGNDNIFALQTGDTLIMKVKYQDAQYIISYEQITATGTKTFEVPADKTLGVSIDALNKTGKAHVSVCGSLLGLDSDWEYTVSVKEGVGLTDEQIAAQEFELSKGTTRASINELAAGVVKAREAADEAIAAKAGAMEDADIQAAYADLDAADAEIVEAGAALDAAATPEDVAAALAIAEGAKAKASAAQASVEQAAEFLEDAPVVDEPKEDEPKEDEPKEDEPKEEEPKEEDKKDSEFNVLDYWWVALIVVAVIVVAVVAASSKKKQ